jgi:hypothetical protein
MPTLPELDEPVTPNEAMAKTIRWTSHTVEKAVVGPDPKDFRYAILLMIAVVATSRAGGWVGAVGSAAIVLLGLDTMKRRK